MARLPRLCLELKTKDRRCLRKIKSNCRSSVFVSFIVSLRDGFYKILEKLIILTFLTRSEI